MSCSCRFLDCWVLFARFVLLLSFYLNVSSCVLDCTILILCCLSHPKRLRSLVAMKKMWISTQMEISLSLPESFCVFFFCLCLFVLVGKAASTQGMWCSEPFNSTARQALIVHIRKGKGKWGVRTCCLKPRKMLESQMWEPPTLLGANGCLETARSWHTCSVITGMTQSSPWYDSVSEQLLVPTSTLFLN